MKLKKIRKIEDKNIILLINLITILFNKIDVLISEKQFESRYL